MGGRGRGSCAPAAGCRRGARGEEQAIATTTTVCGGGGSSGEEVDEKKPVCTWYRHVDIVEDHPSFCSYDSVTYRRNYMY